MLRIDSKYRRRALVLLFMCLWLGGGTVLYFWVHRPMGGTSSPWPTIKSNYQSEYFYQFMIIAVEMILSYFYVMHAWWVKKDLKSTIMRFYTTGAVMLVSIAVLMIGTAICEELTR